MRRRKATVQNQSRAVKWVRGHFRPKFVRAAGS